MKVLVFHKEQDKHLEFTDRWLDRSVKPGYELRLLRQTELKQSRNYNNVQGINHFVATNSDIMNPEEWHCVKPMWLSTMILNIPGYMTDSMWLVVDAYSNDSGTVKDRMLIDNIVFPVNLKRRYRQVTFDGGDILAMLHTFLSHAAGMQHGAEICCSPVIGSSAAMFIPFVSDDAVIRLHSPRQEEGGNMFVNTIPAHDYDANNPLITVVNDRKFLKSDFTKDERLPAMMLNAILVQSLSPKLTVMQSDSDVTVAVPDAPHIHPKSGLVSIPAFNTLFTPSKIYA